jgi:predicted membrane protein
MSADTRSSLRLTPQIILGLCIVTIGVALTLDNLGWVETHHLLRFWPMAIVLVGLAKFLQAEDNSGRVFGGILMFVGVALLGDVLNIFELWAWWPVAMILLGVVMISRAFRGTPAHAATIAGGVAGGAAGSTSDGVISELAFWSGVQRRVASPVFRRADLTAIMGGIEFDLRHASLSGGEAVIDVFAMWGGIEIIVPPDWAVSNQVVPVMGGAEDKSTGTQASTNRLTIRGVAIMGGVEIKT